MSLTNLLLISFLTFTQPSISGNTVFPGCDLTVSSQVKNTGAGRSEGEITISISGDSGNGRYKVFLINKGAERAKQEVKSRKVAGLKAGYYEFVIVDTKGDKCFKELTLQVKEG